MKKRIENSQQIAKQTVALPWYLRGRFKETAILKLIRQSSFFDYEYYTEEYPDVPRGLEEAWSHFINFGWREKRNPSRYFDTEYYLEKYPDVKQELSNPLVHWYVHGRFENRFPFDPFRAISIPQSDALLRLTGERKKIAVCIPVFNSFELTVRCINSVLATVQKSNHDVLIHVHDDYSSDLELIKYLEEKSHKEIILTRASENLGFTKSANYMLRRHLLRDVILLNSDTVVYGPWIDNLCQTAYSASRVASVSAMSNNATIASFPNWPIGDHMEEDDACLIAELLSANDALEDFGMPTVPTAVGSCMYLRRDAINEVGYLDEEKFPRGYGEENQWSMRCQSQGWVNVIALNTFVLHEGGVSFGRESERLKEHGTREMLKQFPQYDNGITEWVKNSDFPRILRSTKFFNFHRIAEVSTVHIMHNFGGGTGKVVHSLAISDAEMWGKNSLILRRQGDLFLMNSIGRFSCATPPGVDLEIRSAELLEVLRELNIASNSIFVHDPFVVEIDCVRQIRSEGRIAKLFLHDYRSVCQRGFKVLPSGLPCNGPGPSICDRCLCLSSTDFNPEIDALDDGYNWFINKNRDIATEYDQIVAPSATASAELSSHLGVDVGIFSIDGKYPIVKNRPIPFFPFPEKSDKAAKVRVAIIGSLGPHKGTRIIRDLVDYAYVNRPEFVFCLVGSWGDVLSAPTMLMDLGKYKDEDHLKEIVEQNEIDIFLIMTPASETFCLTLSDVLSVRNPENAVVIPMGNIWEERMAGQENYAHFNVLGGVVEVLSVLDKTFETRTGISS